MGADFSRIRSNPLLDFAGVELKQGGVVLDADVNELVALIDRRLCAQASDILGRSTVSSTTPDAFKIGLASGTLEIGKGRLYVDGLLAENHGAASDDPAKKLFDPLLGEVAFADPVLYTKQPYLPNPPALPTGGKHLVYLDVWDREVTHLERPDLVEVAVGVETSSRRQTVWQVRVLEADAGDATCATADEDLNGWDAVIAPSTGRLTTGTFDVPPEDDPCELPPTGGYRGLENQTYRVEIHDPGQPGGTATFKWSRDNASVGSRVASVVSSGELELQTLGRDDVLRFNTGDWVEITDDARELSQKSGEIRLITVNEAARRITFTPALPSDMLPAAFPDSEFPRAGNLRVRRWDQSHKVLQAGAGGTTTVFQDLDAGTTGVIKVPAAGTTLLLENGVTVSFASTGAAGFRAGDYWMFAARTADASVELLNHEPPRGIHHHYERLAIWDAGAGTVTDCRHPWPPEGGGHDCSCGACVTPESHASGQFTIQDAVNKVQQTGGTVCLSAGQYVLQEPVRLTNAQSVRVRGQGPATAIVSPGSAFVLRNCVAATIEELLILSLGKQPAVSVATAIGLTLQRLAIAVVGGNDAPGSAIALAGLVVFAMIRENFVLAPSGVLANDPTAQDDEKDDVPKYLMTGALAVEDNFLSCSRQAVSFTGMVAHLLGTRVTGNQIQGCREAAISALGICVPSSSMKINRNTVLTLGDGIRAGVDGLWIESNKISNTSTGTDNRKVLEVGIHLDTGLDKSGIDRCQVLANQVTGFTRAGIVFTTAVSDAIVKMNVVEDCGHGIVCTDNSYAGAVSIENNHLRNIGGDSKVFGIGVARARSAVVAGNTLRDVGVELQQSAKLSAAIVMLDVQQFRVNGNDIAGVAPPGDFGGSFAGITVDGPYLEFDVSQNQVRRDAVASSQPSNGSWYALLIGPAIEQNTGGAGTSGLVTVRLDAMRVMVMGDGEPYIAVMAEAGDNVSGTAPSAVVVQPQQRGAVLNNVLAARGVASAVQVTAPGECLFSGNRVESRALHVAGVVLSTSTAIVNGNRVRGGEPSIQVLSANVTAVVGNITTAGITVPGGLSAPWNALNPIG